MSEKNAPALIRGNILAALVRFALPVLLALFLQAMYGAADLIIVGRFAGTAEQSGVASGSQLFNLITMMITGLSMGVTVLVGNAVGSGEKQLAGRAVGCGAVLFGLLALVITALVVPFAGPLAGLLHAPAEAYEQTAAYLRICGLGTVFITAYNVLGAVFRGLGDSKTPLLTVAIACGVNIVGDLVLVAGFGLGAAGAATATVLAQAVSVAASLYLIRRRGLPFAFSRRFFRPDGWCMRRILRVGVPIALQELLVQFSFLFIQVVVNGMGVDASAAVGVAEKVCMFLMLVASALYAVHLGLRGPEQRGRPARALGQGAVMGALALFGGAQLAGLFTADAAVITGAHAYLKAYAIDCLLTAVLFCFVGYFNGCGRTVFVMVQGIVGAFCVRIPVVYLMSHIPGVGLFEIGLGTPISSVVQILLCIAAYRWYQSRAKQSA